MSDTQIGPDGRRYPIGQVPSAANEKVTPLRGVFGTQAAGQVPVWNATRGRLEWGTSGGSAAGAPVVRKFPFAFDTAGILTGAALYTPTVGDVLVDAWIEVDTAWDGTTPRADIGTFIGTSSGLFNWSVPSNGAVDLAVAASGAAGAGVRLTTGLSLAQLNPLYNLQDAFAVSGAALNAADDFLAQFSNGGVPATFTAANPIKVVVSQTGGVGGADPDATQGAAVLHLVTATPA